MSGNPDFEREKNRRLAAEERVLILEAAVGRLTGERDEALALLRKIDARPSEYQDGGDGIEKVHDLVRRYWLTD
jgi:hypothetical protein